MVLLPCAARRAPFVVSARVRRATRHSLRLTRARPAGPTRRWARTKGCAEPPSRPSPAHLPRSAREATVSGRAHLAGPAAAPPSDVGGGRGRRGAEGSTRTHTAPLAAAADASLRRRARRRTRRRAVRRASSSARRDASSASHETRLGCSCRHRAVAAAGESASAAKRCRRRRRSGGAVCPRAAEAGGPNVRGRPPPNVRSSVWPGTRACPTALARSPRHWPRHRCP